MYCLVSARQAYCYVTVISFEEGCVIRGGGRREASPIARTHDVICSGVEEDEEERRTRQRCRMGTGVIGRRRGFVEGSKETMLLRERRNESNILAGDL